MPRNLFRRVEVAFPIESKPLAERIIEDLHHYLKDNTQAWMLQADGKYQRLSPGETTPCGAQQVLLQTLNIN